MTEIVAQERHKLYEDAMALTLGTLFVSLGMLIYSKTVLLVGSTAGLSLLLSYISGYGFGVSFFLINLPFYALAVRRMGWPFTIRTFVAVGLVALFSRLTTSWIDISHIDPIYATVIGAGLTGTGLLMLFRHRTGLGGINILALYLQEHWKIRAGYFQLAVDFLIMIDAFFVIPVNRLALSILGIVIVNVIIAINHKPGRYMALS
ncbi:YitT family protein [Bradyrhizobium sp. SZCCHNS3051]|uniref:YitT family protein n=1 Tax=Bradyrhizobium sp. SZCCHNS3051 TaxID=3057320 RepID=UPI0029165C8F|nr:YitT family protein [Bradyrhizobium sp. SZCCHNS3051]